MMEIDLLGLLQGKVGLLESELEATEQRVYGVTLGVVTDIDDTKRLGRVKVRFPWLSDRIESAWARIAVPWAGQRRGSYFLPEVDDEVLVAFRHGDLRYPYVLGFLWGENARPPEPDPRLERRELRSKSGHLLVFDDSKERESLILQSQGGHRVVLDDGAGTITVSTPSDAKDVFSVVLDAKKGTITVSTQQGDIALKSTTGTFKVEAANIELRATSGSMNLRAATDLTVNGGVVRIN